jgi:hypothetical protein
MQKIVLISSKINMVTPCAAYGYKSTFYYFRLANDRARIRGGGGGGGIGRVNLLLH